jgi:hypothetical protein
MACPHVAGVTALWLAQTAATAPAPPPAATMKNVLQCGTVKGVVNLWDATTANLLLQVPPAGVLDLSEAPCSPDSGCADCSGENQQCLFGFCSCASDWCAHDDRTPFHWKHQSHSLFLSDALPSPDPSTECCSHCVRGIRCDAPDHEGLVTSTGLEGGAVEMGSSMHGCS